LEIVLPGTRPGKTHSMHTGSDSVLKMAQALETYFDGEDPPIEYVEDLLEDSHNSPFRRAVLREVAAIRRGMTSSYGDIAGKAGKPNAARAVGNIMSTNPFPIIIPCHRVIKSDGSPGRYGARESMKIWLLGFEGAPLNLVG
jgi:methylated-DNA-[protein]-cysteine S-methyltransferase